ncbi:MAG: cupin domain-containing protein [Fibrobacter sp.]|nr:cupin domain-containing protein [Fibrobacter sp.]
MKELQGMRFCIYYRVTTNDSITIDEYARDIALEQTVETPLDCIPDEHINRGITGQVESIRPVNKNNFQYDICISYHSDVTARSIPQFLNVLFGNISLKNNIRIIDFSIPYQENPFFPGPSYGITGIRKISGVYGRPLTCTALKPLGLPPIKLAEIAAKFCNGGADFIKDDHGLSDQSFHPFKERVARCQEAVSEQNIKNGSRTLYCPMVSGRFDEITSQVEYALSCGVKSILIAPMLVGMDTVRYIAQTYRPVILAHPSFTGTHFHDHNHGMTPAVLLGKLFRLIGADVSIFPNAGGRFGFSTEECNELAHALREPVKGFLPAFPSPAGGMKIEKIDSIVQQFGKNSMLLIGGSILQHPEGIEAGTNAFVNAVKKVSETVDNKLNEYLPFPTACEIPVKESYSHNADMDILRCKSFRWDNRTVESYKSEGPVNFKGISRQNLTGNFGEKTSFDLRYFEIEPQGYSSLERHEHEHVIIGARGKGIVKKGGTEHLIRPHDIAYVRPHEVHQIINRWDKPFGFYCIVDHERDKPVALEQD